jgi:hypothetical protein
MSEEKSEIELVYEALVGRPSDLSRGTITPPKNAPDRVLSAQEAGKVLPKAAISKRQRQIHNDFHVPQGGRFVGCSLCRSTPRAFEERVDPRAPGIVTRKDPTGVVAPQTVCTGAHGEATAGEAER